VSSGGAGSRRSSRLISRARQGKSNREKGWAGFPLNGFGGGRSVETSSEAQALSGAGFIMQAGCATTVTTFDGWMLRQMWQKF